MGQSEMQKIVSLLESAGVRFELLVHVAVFTSEQAARVRGVSLSLGVKAMLLQSNTKQFFLFCLSADNKIDLKKAALLAGVGRLFLASKESVLRVTNCEVGSVSPFSGVLSGVPVFFDRGILAHEVVEFNVGLHTHSVRMKSSDLVNLAKPVLGSFSLQ